MCEPIRSEARDFEADLDAFIRPGLDILNLPKADKAETVRTVAERLEKLETRRGIKKRIGLLVNIETPRALKEAFEIATASDRIVGLQLGFGDLFSPLGIDRTPASQGPILLAVRLAAGEAGVPAYDGAFVVVSDLEGFRAEAEAARAMGFAGKTCIHPSQARIANSVFSPRECGDRGGSRGRRKGGRNGGPGGRGFHSERRNVRRPSDRAGA